MIIDKTCIMINESHTIYTGFSNESAPRSVFPAVIGSPKD
jgi:actin-related protein